VGEESQLTEVWDWRQSFARYSDTIEDQVVHHAVPESPQGVGAGHQPSAAPHGASKESGWRPDSEPDADPSPQSAGPPPPVALRGGRRFSIAAFVCGVVAPLCFPLILGPFILGPLGVIFGFVASAKGDRIGRWAGLMSLATTVLGIALSLWVAGNLGLHFAA
jgi:hypothetical protein